MQINGHNLQAGDGVALSQEKDIELEAKSDRSEILLFDLSDKNH